MRLLFLNAVGTIGGAERVLLTLFAGLRDRNLEIFLIVGAEGELIKAAEQLGVKVFCLPLPGSITQLGDSGARSHFSKLKVLLKSVLALPKFLTYLRTLQRTIQRTQPDLIHSNNIKTHILLASLWRIQIPIIWHIHDFYGSRPLVAQLLRGAQRNVKSAIAVSNAVAKDAIALFPKLSIQVIYNAVQIPAQIQSVHAKNPRIGLVGTFARWKGHDVFLQAAAQVLKKMPNAQFRIVGAPIYHTKGSQFSLAELRSMATDLKLGTAIEFVGFQADPASIYQTLDIVVHASTQPEPFGLVIAEAMSFGKAVIVSNAGGAAELVTDQYDAIAVQPGDVQGLAQAMIELIRDPQKRQALGNHARQTAIEKYHSDRLVDELIKIYFGDRGLVKNSGV